MRLKNQAELEKWLATRDSKVKLPTSKDIPRDKTPVDATRQRRILGLDTALRTTGWGIIDARANQMQIVDCGLIKNQSSDRLSACLKKLSGGLQELIVQYRPDIAVIEGGFFCRNVKTAIVLGAARGAVIAALANADIPVFEYAPRKVKQAVCGFGNASKQQVALLVAQLLSIRVDKLPLDSTDALALAICHAQNLTVAQGYGLDEEI